MAHSLYKNRSEENDVTVHQNMIDIAHYMNVAECIYNNAKDDIQFQTFFPQFCNAYDAVLNGKETKSIVQDLKSSTFQGSPSAFSNVGRIALVAERLEQQKEAFIPLLKAMGEIDEYMAIVDFKKQHKKWTYTRPSENKEQGAWVKADNFVHPRFPESISNSIVIGADEASIIETTGPNACGKSFTAKALLANILLSQAYRFALADKFEHAYFDGGMFYIANIRDQAGESSRYEAEIAKMISLYALAREFKEKNKLCISVVDEPFSGTNSESGAQTTEEFITAMQEEGLPKYIAQILITHHTLSEREGVAHYCVEDNDDRYKWKRGRSTYSNAVALFKKALEKKKRENTTIVNASITS